ncbi:hypothetical protein AB1Y20_013979 [Prymnesium parvum]|uniref:Uncharacterized protein n=1 Tax=Prymnesium parvum TaxID=97485 RepID=A0AB34IGN5_PRYPA
MGSRGTASRGSAACGGSARARSAVASTHSGAFECCRRVLALESPPRGRPSGAWWRGAVGAAVAPPEIRLPALSPSRRIFTPAATPAMAASRPKKGSGQFKILGSGETAEATALPSSLS